MVSGLKFLIACNSPERYSFLSKILMEAGFNTVWAQKRVNAQEFLTKEPIYCALIDFDFDSFSCISLIRFIRTYAVNVHSVLFIENKMELDHCSITEEDIYKSGFSIILEKNCSEKVFFESIENSSTMSRFMTVKEREINDQFTESDESDENFFAVNIGVFLSTPACVMDIYIKIKANRYLKIFKSHDGLDKERIRKYIEKGTTQLFFRTSDRLRYIDMCNYITEKILKSKKIETSKKADILKQSVSLLLEHAHTDELRPQFVTKGIETINNVFKFIETDKNLYKYLCQLRDVVPDEYSHSFLVTLYSAAIMEKLEVGSVQLKQTLAMAAMLHDLGKTKINPDVVDKNEADFTPDDWQEYMRHPFLSAEMTSASKIIPPTVSDLVLSHHERSDGSGFPKALKSSRLTLYASVLIFADFMAEQVIHTNTPPTQVMTNLLVDRKLIPTFDSRVMHAFCETLVEPDKLKSLFRK